MYWSDRGCESNLIVSEESIEKSVAWAEEYLWKPPEADFHNAFIPLEGREGFYEIRLDSVENRDGYFGVYGEDSDGLFLYLEELVALCEPESFIQLFDDDYGEFTQISKDINGEVRGSVQDMVNPFAMERYEKEKSMHGYPEASIQWNREDFAAKLEEMGYEPSDSNIDAITDYVTLENMQEQGIAAGWDVMEAAIADRGEELEAAAQAPEKGMSLGDEAKDAKGASQALVGGKDAPAPGQER